MYNEGFLKVVLCLRLLMFKGLVVKAKECIVVRHGFVSRGCAVVFFFSKNYGRISLTGDKNT